MFEESFTSAPGRRRKGFLEKARKVVDANLDDILPRLDTEHFQTHGTVLLLGAVSAAAYGVHFLPLVAQFGGADYHGG